MGAAPLTLAKLLKLVAALFVATCLFACTSLANTEIVNFGPVMCRADAQGKEDLFAAEKLAADWPTLRPADGQGIFSVKVERKEASASPLSESRHGAWMRLELAQSDAHLLEGNRSSIPRDRFLQDAWNTIAWALNLRFTVRASTAANIPMDVTLRVMNAHDMLAAGQTQRVAKPIEKEGQDAQGTNSSEAGSGASSTPDVHFGEAPPESTVHVKTEDDDEVPTWPCTVAYLQLLATRSDVGIPERIDCQPGSSGVKNALWRFVRSHYFDRLAWDAGKPCRATAAADKDAEETTVSDAGGVTFTISGGEAEKEPPVEAPTMLVLEQLHLGAVPTTAVYLLFLLFLSGVLTYGFLVPLVTEVVLSAASQQREKTE